MDITFIFIIIALVLLFFISGYLNEKKNNKAFNDKLKKEYGNRNDRKYSADDLKAVKGLFKHISPEEHIDDITWNDLEMWTVYKQMNYCKSSSGDEYLYYLLRCPVLRGFDWNTFEDKIEKLCTNESDRIKLSLCLSKMGRSGKYSIFDYLEKIDEIGNYTVAFDILLDLLYIPAIVLCFFNGLLGAILFILLVTINVILYFKKKRKIEPYIICFNYINNVLINAKTIVGENIDVLKEEKSLLEDLLKHFKAFKRFYFVVSGNVGNGPAGVLLDYCKMFTHIDLIKFKTLLFEINANKTHVEKIVSLIGQIDCYLSIGEYRKYLGNYSIPQFCDSGNDEFRVCEIYHPLLKNPVCNDLTIRNGIILTGSNASGKSTFLKTIALNILFAQTIHTVCAKEYIGQYMAVFTSLNLKDSISSGDSYYMTEIKAIKRIIEAAQYYDVKVVGFVDEVLRGTNTTERIASSCTILNNMNKNNIMVFAATHDLELASLLDGVFSNYHFQEALQGDDVSFPYKISEGKATSRNAIILLEKLGFDNNITQNAQKMVDDFEKKGIWSLQ